MNLFDKIKIGAQRPFGPILTLVIVAPLASLAALLNPDTDRLNCRLGRRGCIRLLNKRDSRSNTLRQVHIVRQIFKTTVQHETPHDFDAH